MFKFLSDALAALVVTLSAAGCAAENTGHPSLKMRLAQSDVNPDSVGIVVSFKNNSDSAISLYYWKGQGTMGPAVGTYLTFEIELDGGKPFDCIGFVPMPLMPHPGDLVTVEPGGSYEETFVLNRLYMRAEDRQAKISSWPPGKYRIVCRYEFSRDSVGGAEVDLWQGRIVSDAFEFEID